MITVNFRLMGAEEGWERKRKGCGGGGKSASDDPLNDHRNFVLDEDFYDSLVTLLNKQQLDDVSSDKLDMEAIAKGDFGDVSKGVIAMN